MRIQNRERYHGHHIVLQATDPRGLHPKGAGSQGSHSMSPKFSLASLILSSNFASRPVFGTRLVMVDLVLLAAVTEVP